MLLGMKFVRGNLVAYSLTFWKEGQLSFETNNNFDKSCAPEHQYS